MHVHRVPDGAGNVTSPTSACFDQIAFVDCLMELALVAEISNGRCQLYTQARVRSNEGLDHFDGESLAIQSDIDSESNRRAALQLAEQVRLTRELNRLQTSRTQGPTQSQSVARGDTAHLAPAIPPSLLNVPHDQELVSAAGMRPQARGDLVQLVRLSVEGIAAAFGVPVGAILSQHYAGNAHAELKLLNSTVRELAKVINSVLTERYHAIYGEDDTNVGLCVSPLSSSEELVKLNASGLLPPALGMERAMQALGASRDTIHGMMCKAQGRGTKRARA